MRDFFFAILNIYFWALSELKLDISGVLEKCLLLFFLLVRYINLSW